MTTITVWILILQMGGPVITSAPMAVIDNIATEEECERLRQELPSMQMRGVCFKVLKAK